MRMMASFFRAYPGRTTVMLLALLLSGVAEGVGLSALLPLLNIAVGQDVTAAVTGVNTPRQSEFERTVLEVFATVGISPTLGNMLLITPPRSLPTCAWKCCGLFCSASGNTFCTNRWAG
jgi:ATP-binding cassette subfamily C protein